MNAPVRHYAKGELNDVQAVGAAIGLKSSNERPTHVLIHVNKPSLFDKLKMSATLTLEGEGTESIMQACPLVPLAEISDFKGGLSFGAVTDKKSIGDTIDGVTSTPAPPSLDYGCVAMVPIGRPILSGADKLDVSITVGTALISGDKVFACLVGADDGPEVLIRYAVKQISDANFFDAVEVWLFRNSGVSDETSALEALATDDLSITTQVVGGERFGFDARQALAYQEAVGNHEGSAPKRTLLLHRPGVIAQDLTVTLNGAQATNYSVLGIEEFGSVNRQHRASAVAAQHVGAALQHKQVTKPASYQRDVLRHSITPNPGHLLAKAAQVIKR